MPLNSKQTTIAPSQAMILAAGRGARMRPLTDHTPKPLLAVQGEALIQRQMRALAQGGFTRQLINTAWLGAQIEQRFGATPNFPGTAPIHLRYSHEGEALETAGGILRALPQLASIFWVVAGDVFIPQFCFTAAAVARFAASDKRAHLWLVANPAHHPEGDFGIAANGDAQNADQATVRYTFSTIALYRHEFFAHAGIESGNPQGVVMALAPLLRAAIDRHEVSAELYSGAWTDVGTPERLRALG